MDTSSSEQPLELSIGPSGPEGPVGMPGLRGPNADGSPGETEEEHWQRWREAIAHNERYFAKYPRRNDSDQITQR